MTSGILYAERLREVFFSGLWIANTNYRHQLEQIRWTQAVTKVQDLNTIWALVYHISYYLGGVNQVFEGGPLEIRDKYSYDAPELNSEDDWQIHIQEFLRRAEVFCNHVEVMDDLALNGVFVDSKYGTYARNIEGMLEHAYYHLGQIVLLRKLTMPEESIKSP